MNAARRIVVCLLLAFGICPADALYRELGYAPLRCETQGGDTGVTVPEGADPVDFAHTLAVKRGEAVAVTQHGRFVCLVNPR